MNSDSSAITVVVPVYNVEIYLSACLGSLLRQTFADFEIICVNDGSTDGSRDILTEFAAKDPRIILIDQSNKGLSEARNSGIRAARGKYICFVDSDDLLEAEALGALFTRASTEDLDVLLYRWTSFSDDPAVISQLINESSKDYTGFDLKGIFSGRDLFCELIENKAYNASACIQFIRLEHLHNTVGGFKAGILHEDELFTPVCLIQAKRAALMNEAFFQRRVRSDSIMTRSYSHKNVQSYFEVFCGLLSFYASLDPNDRLESACRDSLFSQYRMAASIYSELTEDERGLISFTKNSLNGLLFDLIIAGKEGTMTKDLLFAQESYHSVIDSTSFKLGRKLTAVPRKIRSLGLLRH